jgi:orotidine-5'-phosphate decarboxylase
MPVERAATRATERGIVALDVSTAQEARALVDRLGAGVAFYKVGLELFTAAGPEPVETLRAAGKRVFLDLKLHDIPNTVGRAARAAHGLGADMLTVHAGGGRDMVRAAVESAPGVRVVAVTALTSLDPRDLPPHLRRDRPLGEWVLDLTEESLAAGAAGVVLAASEVAAVKARFGARCLCVVPGVRAAGGERHDQARVATPAEALAAGADYLVIGRAVTQAADPLMAWNALWSQVPADAPQEGTR